MVCRKCKHEMPDGLRYCGHCGRKMSRVEYFINWSFEKKRLPITIAVLVLLAGLLIWGVVSLVPGPGSYDTPVEAGDYGVFPLMESFVDGVPMGAVGEGPFPYMDGALAVGFDEETDLLGKPYYAIDSDNPLWLYVSAVKPEYAEKIPEYLALLEEDIFCLELIHQQTLDDGEWYFYRYTGDRQVYPVGQHDDVSTDLGECHVWIRVSPGGTRMERWTGLGLEGIWQEEYEAILAGQAYHRRTDELIRDTGSD